MQPPFRIALCAALAIATLSGCQREAHPTVGAIEIRQPWVRAMAPNAPAAGSFMVLHNAGDAPDRLVTVSSPDAERVENHEARNDGGVMRMRPLEGGLPLPAGATVALEPGGYHLMLVGPTRRFAEGEEVTLELGFERAGTSALRMPVRPIDATSAQTSAHH